MCCGARFSVPSFPRDLFRVCVPYLPSKYPFPGGMVFALIPDPIFQDGSTVGRDSVVGHCVVG